MILIEDNTTLFDLGLMVNGSINNIVDLVKNYNLNSSLENGLNPGDKLTDISFNRNNNFVTRYINLEGNKIESGDINKFQDFIGYAFTEGFDEDFDS